MVDDLKNGEQAVAGRALSSGTQQAQGQAGGVPHRDVLNSRVIAEVPGDGIFIINREGFYEYVNSCTADRLGCSREEIIGQCADGFLPLAVSQRHREYLDRVFQTGKPVTFEEKTGSAEDGHWSHIFLLPLRYKGEAVDAVLGIGRDLTESKRVEAALRVSENNYRTIFENTGTATMICDEEMTINLANSEFAELSGYTREELEGKMGWLQLVVPEDRKRLKGYHGARRRDPGAAPRNYEFDFLTGNGEVRNIYATVGLIPGTAKSVLSLLDITELKQAEAKIHRMNEWLERKVGERTRELIAVNRELQTEIIERKRMEHALRASEEKFRSIFSQSPLGIELCDQAGRLIEINSACLELFGIVDPDELKGFNLFDYLQIPSDEKEKLQQGEIVAFEIDYDFETVKKEHHYQTTQTGPRCLSYVVGPLGTETDVLQGYLVFVRDISEWRRADESLQQREEHFRALIENSSDLIMIIGEDGTILYEGPSVKHILGYAPEDMVGMSVFDVFHPDDIPEMVTWLRNPEEKLIISQVRHRNGSWRILEGKGKRLRGDPLYTGIVVNLRDITERKQAEVALRESEERYRSLFQKAKKDEAKLADQLELARQFQMKFLDPLDNYDGFDLAQVFYTAGRVGGDFYGVVPLLRDPRVCVECPEVFSCRRIVCDHLAGKYGIVIGDVLGHGIPAALYMARTLSLFQEVGRVVGDPAAVLDKINKSCVKEQLEVFTTAYYGVLDVRQKNLQYASAGHEKGIIYRKDRRQIEVLESGGFPLGLFAESSYNLKEAGLAPGDKLFLYTDGLVEAQGRGKARFGRDRLRAMLVEIGHLPLPECVAALTSAFNEFRDGVSLQDDTAVLVIEMLTSDYWKLVLPSMYEEMRQAVTRLEETLKKCCFPQETFFPLHLAFEEALINTIEHAHAFDSSRSLFVSCSGDERQIEVTIRGEGEGFDYEEALAKVAQGGDVLDTRGRGLLLIRECTDRFYFRDRGKEIHLIKYNPRRVPPDSRRHQLDL